MIWARFPKCSYKVTGSYSIVSALCGIYRYKIATGDPLTAVPMASMTVLPICPCLYRGFL